MTAPPVAAVGSICPDCSAPLPGGPTGCEACGLPLVGPVAVELYQLDLSLARLGVERDRLLARRPSLLARLRAGDIGGTGVAEAPVSGAANGRGVQGLLLGLGVAALLVGVLVFVSVAWAVLGVAGQVLVLLAVTGGVAVGARVAARRGLAATAESLAVLATGLGLADLYAARSLDLAGLAGAPAAAYWTVAFGLLAGLAGLLGRDSLGGAAFPALAVAAAAVSAGTALGEVDPAGLQGAVLLAAAALAAAGTDVLHRVRTGRLTPAVGTGLAASVVLVLAAQAQAWVAVTDGSLAGRVSGSAVTLGLVVLVHLALRRAPSGPAAALRGWAALTAAVTLLIDVLPLGVRQEIAVGGRAVLVLAVVTLALGTALALRPGTRLPGERALLEVAAATAALAGVAVLGEGGDAFRLTLLLALAGAAATFSVLRPRLAAVATPAGLTALALAALPAGELWWSSLVDAVVMLAAGLVALAVAAARRGRVEEPGAGLVALVAALGAFGIALDAGPGERGGALVAGIVALAVLAYSLLPARGRLAILGVGAATTCTWLLEHDAGVGVVEAYSLPLAAMLALLGLVAWRRDPAAPTWLTLGPAVSAALLPTAVVSLDESGFGRAAVALVLGAVLVAVGAWRGWQAPVVTGTVAVLLVLVTRGAPVVAQVPQWMTLTVVGAALVTVGATYERRRRELGSAGRWVAALR